MNDEIIKYIRCPYDDTSDFDVGDERVTCRHCSRNYPVANGILSMMTDGFVSDTSEEAKFKRTEQAVRDEQAEGYMGWFGAYTNSIEWKFITRYLRPEIGDTIVDIGAGIGRYTIPLSSLCRQVIAVDYSLRSLLILKSKIEELGIKNVYLIQADVCHLPLKEHRFDKAMSSQVLTFIPSEAARSSALENIRRVLVPHGKLVLTVFNNHIFRKIKLLRGIQGVFHKEGTHPVHNFYYFNFSRWDLSPLLSKNGFRVERVIGVCNFPRERVKSYQQVGFKKYLYLVDVLISATPLSYIFGDLLLASTSST